MLIKSVFVEEGNKLKEFTNKKFFKKKKKKKKKKVFGFNNWRVNIS
jgi:hypothetical protein